MVRDKDCFFCSNVLTWWSRISWVTPLTMSCRDILLNIPPLVVRSSWMNLTKSSLKQDEKREPLHHDAAPVPLPASPTWSSLGTWRSGCPWLSQTRWCVEDHTSCWGVFSSTGGLRPQTQQWSSGWRWACRGRVEPTPEGQILWLLQRAAAITQTGQIREYVG